MLRHSRAKTTSDTRERAPNRSKEGCRESPAGAWEAVMSQTKQFRRNLTQPGILAALGAALPFGSGTPFAKLLPADVSPWLMCAAAHDWLLFSILALESGSYCTGWGGKPPRGQLPTGVG